jgi:hypothetical protein
MTSQTPTPSGAAPIGHHYRQPGEPGTAPDLDDHDHEVDVAPPPPGSDVDEHPKAMIPARTRRRSKVERVSMRALATGGILAIATILGAVLVSQHVAGWIVGLAVGTASVILAAVLWSSRQL